MRPLHNVLHATIVLSLIGLITGCANVQAPLPPSLELPKPPNDLRAVRKGNRVFLYWSVPAQTLDRQRIRHPGPTRICRSLDLPMKTCGTPVGNLATIPSNPTGSQAATPFSDALPPEFEQQNLARLASYAVEAMNPHARSAGLSNEVQVPLVPTLPPPANFHAELSSKGIALTWDCETLPPE